MRELVKTFGGRRVVNGVSFELQRGEIFGFLGPNGSGKTTTMRMALDLIKPDSGSVALLGGMPPRRALRRVGYLPEERGLFRRAQVIDSLRYLGLTEGSRRQSCREARRGDAEARRPGGQCACDRPGPIAWNDPAHPVLGRPAPSARPDNSR